MLIIPTLRKLRQEVYHEFQSNLGYTMRLFLKNKQTNKQKEKIKGVGVGNVVWLVEHLPSMLKALGPPLALSLLLCLGALTGTFRLFI